MRVRNKLGMIQVSSLRRAAGLALPGETLVLSAHYVPGSGVRGNTYIISFSPLTNPTKEVLWCRFPEEETEAPRADGIYPASKSQSWERKAKLCALGVSSSVASPKQAVIPHCPSTVI